MFATKSSLKTPKKAWPASRWLPIAGICFTALLAGGCGAGDASGLSSSEEETENLNLTLYTPQNLPSNFSVDVPESLDQSDSAADSGGTGRIVMQKAKHAMKSRLLSKEFREGRTGFDKKSGRTAQGSSTTTFGKRGILSDADGDGYDDETYEWVGEDSYEYTATGYYELQNVVSQMQWKKQEVALNFLMADAIFDQVQAACAQTAAGDTCSIQAGEVTMVFTEEMMNFILDTMGIKTDDPYYDMYAEGYRSMIGAEMPVPALSYTVLDGSGGYDHQLVMDNGSWEDYSSSTSLRWDSARTKVELVYNYGSSSWGEGSDSYSYDDADKRVVYRNTNSYGGSSWTYAMTLQEDAEKADAHGVRFVVRSDYQDASSQYVMDLSGVADDYGGYVETTYTSTYTALNVTAGFENLEPYQYYYVVSGPSCGDTLDWNSVVGGISTWDNYACDEFWNCTSDGVVSSADETYASLWGGTGLPDTYSVCAYSYSYDESTYQYTESLTSVGGTVTLGVGATYTDMYKYAEGFDADGSLTFSAWSWCDPDTGVCDAFTYEGTEDGLYGEEEASESEYYSYYDDASSSGEFIEAPVFVLSENTDGALAALDPYSTYVVFTSDGSGQPDDYWSNVLGYAYYDSWSNCEYVDDGYGGYTYTCGEGSWATYFWGTEEEAGIVDAYLYTYDPNTYEYGYTATLDFGLTVQ